MLSEDRKKRATSESETSPVRRRDAGRDQEGAVDPQVTADNVRLYDETYLQHQRMLTDLWGPEMPYTRGYEERASIVDRLFYGWVFPTLKLASQEKLSRSDLPQPSRLVRTHDCGFRLSRALQAALYKRNAWGALVGARVVSRLDAASSGVLRWVGVPQQGGYTRVMAAVEWDVAPAPRVAAQSECAECSPFFNGTVHGEHLFEPTRPDKCTLEDCESLTFPDAALFGKKYLDPPPSLNLATKLYTTLPEYVWRCAPLLLLTNVSQLATPMVLKAFVQYLSTPEEGWGTGIGLVVAMFCCLAGESYFWQSFNFLAIRAGLEFRTSLNAVMFEKCFTISAKARALPEMSAGRIMNMVSVDAERAFAFMVYCHHLWSSPLLLVVSLLMLFQLVGWTVLMAVVAFLAAAPLSAHFISIQMGYRRQQLKITDKRIKATNEFLSGIRIAKFMTWEPPFIARIEDIRSEELVYLRKMQYCSIVTHFIANATPLIMVAAVFVVYAWAGHTLTPEVVFPTIALLGILRQPFRQIPNVFHMMVQYLISTKRIAQFLECDNASFSTVKSVEDYFTEGADHSLSCQLAGVFEHTDITAFIPVRLPVAPKVRLTFVGRLLHRFGCEACAPPGKRPAPTAVVEDEEGGGGAVTPPAGSPASPAEPKKAPGQAQPKDEFFQLEPKVLLRDLSVQIPAGKLTLVLGATGCGKSTLLNALLGQFEVSRGHVWATKSIAYVPQQPWIMNATVRNNILFFDEEDAGRLDAAIRVSQLETDLGLFAAGLETEIGEKGINLSGGQKARVSLARAVYADRDMYLLDDPLSALDAHVGERIVDDCFLGQLAGKTRVLATHQLHVVPKADYVVFLKDGRIQFTGNAKDFMSTEMYTSMISVASGTAGTAGAATELGAKEVAPAEAERISAAGEQKPKTGREKGSKLMTKEEKATGSVPWSTYLTYFDYCGGRKVALFVVSVFVVTELFIVAGSVFLSIWSTHSAWGWAPFAYLAFVVLGVGGAPTRFYYSYKAMRVGCTNMHAAMLRSVAKGTMEFFDTTPLGRMVNRFSRDIDLVDNGLQATLISALECVLAIVSSMLVTIVTQPIIIVPLIPAAYVYYRVMVFYNAANREVRRNTSVQKSPLFSILGELLAGTSTIEAYGRANVIMKEALERLDIVFSCTYLENAMKRWLAVRIEVLSYSITTLIALFGVVTSRTGWLVRDVGLVSLSITMAMQTTGQLNWLVRMSAAVEADMNSVERIQHYVDHIDKEEMPELSDEVDVLEKRIGEGCAEVTIEADTTSTNGRGNVVKAGSLEFRDVQMRYREGLPLVLRDVSFRIAPREKVGIVGRTGSGKSTLLLTFMRMVDICGGEIVVSGQPIRSYPLRELRKQFSMIPQDPVLFDGTVRLNVDPFLEASSAEVWDALELVGLRERIASEPEGIDGRVLEGGSNFSVGQRQLLCMARALLKKGSGFILMDEVTANIDQSLDRHIQGTVMKAFSAYTVITIAHRLQTVAQYDKIIVMDHGVVAEMGSPRELARRAGSIFRGMVEALGEDAAETMRVLMNEGICVDKYGKE